MHRRRGPGRPFVKGVPRVPNAGRRKGTPNKVTTDIGEYARRILSDPIYQQNLLTRLREGKAPHMETLLSHYGHGLPHQRVEVTGADGGPVIVQQVSQAGEQFQGRMLRLVKGGILTGNGADGDGPGGDGAIRAAAS